MQEELAEDDFIIQDDCPKCPLRPSEDWLLTNWMAVMEIYCFLGCLMLLLLAFGALVIVDTQTYTVLCFRSDQHTVYHRARKDTQHPRMTHVLKICHTVCCGEQACVYCSRVNSLGNRNCSPV